MGFKLFKILLTMEIILLFIQFWLGMSLNLFVSVPLLTPFNYSGYVGGTEVLVHIINGLLVLILAGFILSYGYRLRKSISWLSVLALVFAIIAPISGYNYMLQEQAKVLSMAMAVSFIVTFAAFLVFFSMLDKAGYES